MPRAKERTGFEAEMWAMQKCHEALADLDFATQHRVLSHLMGAIRDPEPADAPRHEGSVAIGPVLYG